ncbi:hypothetical protein ABMC89_16755 [Sulfitobacter sp. HNIBRBA3233]|uniref:hypothetical protein n=1 Tax=Sulfitobacter marinivivus TaxID=3158558 RepID=UPI0032E04E05
MFLRFAIFILACWACGPALAGPWLRDRGDGFSAYTFASNANYDTATQTYLEFGLTDTTTIGADIGFVRPRYGFQGGYATLFMRRALSKPDAVSKWAYEIGVGANWAADLVLPHFKTTLTWGRGLSFADKTGWTTVDAAVIWDPVYALHVAKLDGTLGINFSDKVAGMMQVYMVHANGASAATLAPSIIFSPADSKFRFQIGTETAVGNVRGTVLKLGLWHNF